VPIAVRLQTRDKKQIDYLNRAVADGHADGAGGRGNRQAFGVWHFQPSAIGQVNVERLERLRPVHSSESLDRHGTIESARRCRAN